MNLQEQVRIRDKLDALVGKVNEMALVATELKARVAELERRSIQATQKRPVGRPRKNS